MADSVDYALPYDLVPATEHHGAYICTSAGLTVCDFYAMSDPSSLSVRNGGTSKPIPFTDADNHAAYMAMAGNAHADLVAALSEATLALDGMAKGEGVSKPIEQTIVMARAAIAKAGAA